MVTILPVNGNLIRRITQCELFKQVARLGFGFHIGFKYFNHGMRNFDNKIQEKPTTNQSNLPTAGNYASTATTS
jgi:hypothetical protein